jgi:hypothetical protein
LSLLNSLASPLSLALNDASCTDPTTPGGFRAGLERDRVALPCVDAAQPGYRVCRDGDAEFQVVGYAGEREAEDGPGVFGLGLLIVGG